MSAGRWLAKVIASRRGYEGRLQAVGRLSRTDDAIKVLLPRMTSGPRELSISASFPAGTYLYRLIFEGHGERQEAKGSLVRIR